MLRANMNTIDALAAELSTNYMPSVKFFLDKTTHYPPLLGIGHTPDILFSDGISVELDRVSVYKTLLRFSDHCLDRDGYDWIIQTVGLNVHLYQLLKLRYALLYGLRDYKRVHQHGPDDTAAYFLALLTSGFPDAECRAVY